MTKDEALKMALEVMRNQGDVSVDEWIATEKAIKAALEAKDEPVAWRTFDGEGGYDYRTYDMNENYANEWNERNPKHNGWVEPLYTTPPQRTWVGLTNEETIAIELGLRIPTGYRDAYDMSLHDFARAIEAKLKEKNG